MGIMETTEMERELYCPWCGEDLSDPQDMVLNDCCEQFLIGLSYDEEEEYYEEDPEELNFDED
jgi:hypothetical protein